MGTIAKRIGELWGKLSPEEKEKYQGKAREEKGRVALETEALREAGLLIEDSAAGSGGAQGGFVLPVARVRKIVKLDPEVKGLSKEGIQLITKASVRVVCCCPRYEFSPGRHLAESEKDHPRRHLAGVRDQAELYVPSRGRSDSHRRAEGGTQIKREGKGGGQVQGKFGS